MMGGIIFFWFLVDVKNPLFDRLYFYEAANVTSRGYSARMYNLYRSTDLIYFDDKKIHDDDGI